MSRMKSFEAGDVGLESGLVANEKLESISSNIFKEDISFMLVLDSVWLCCVQSYHLQEPENQLNKAHVKILRRRV